MKHYLRMICTGMLLLLGSGICKAQGDIIVNLAPVDGIDLTPDNLFNFQIQSGRRSRALIRGTVQFRKSDLRISYRFEYDLQPGMNLLSSAMVHPQLEYSSPALRELFEQYQKLPQGIYEYCVSVQPDYNQNETVPGPLVNECVYHKSEDVFLINLIDPENDAKIYEYNPMLSWTVNYPFASALTYRIRIAEIKEGQNTAGAISRNNPIYDERNLMQMSIVYPVYAKPLQKNQPYAWTVDAYYKGLLLGGAEPWKFTIIEDSLLVAVPRDQSYYEFAEHRGETAIYAIDTLKLKYRTYASSDSLQLSIRDEKGEEVKYKTSTYSLRPGMNFIALDLPGKVSVKHMKLYTLYIRTGDGKQFQVPFRYVNPLYLNK